VDEPFSEWSIEDDPYFSLIATAEDEFHVDTLMEQVQIVPSHAFVEAEDHAPFESGWLTLSPLRPLLVVFERHLESAPDREIWEHPHAPAVGRFLARWISEDGPVTYLGGDGVLDITVRGIAGSDFPNILFVPAQDDLSTGTVDPRAMHRIVARLRRPDGCPWDRKQTNATLAKNLVDEVYEAVDAIERGDMANLAEELGDLYLLILMQAQIAHEAGHFSIEDVYRGIATKIVGRHPHVFGNEFAGDAEDVVGIWQEVKAREKSVNGHRPTKDVDGEPFSMPALTRASRVLKKHPVVADDETSPLLREVAAIVARGEDPEKVLREQLREHVTRYS
jgi:NTP pyrophosphatase (non-canonical NTP hydrolase)